MHCLGQRSRGGQLGSIIGQFTDKFPMATKFGWKNPWPEPSALLVSKVMRGSSQIRQGSIRLENWKGCADTEIEKKKTVNVMTYLLSAVVLKYHGNKHKDIFNFIIQPVQFTQYKSTNF